jgi:hypothetical protein
MLHRRKRALAVAAMVGLVLASSGCALLDPYVRAPELNALDASAAGVTESTLPENKALLQAFSAAAAQRKAYYDAVSTRAKVRNSLPLILIPLSAAALYKGVSSDGGESTRKLLLKEGLVGASVYGLGTYYTAPGRDQIYLAGAKALSCSIYALTPYYLPDAIAERLSIENVEALQDQLALVLARTQEARDFAVTVPARRAAADALFLRADQSVANARAVLRRSVDAQMLLADAGARLRATVENVVAEVNAQIAATEPDPAVILTMVGNLGASAKVFAPGATFAKAGAAGDAKQVLGFQAQGGSTDALTLLADDINGLDSQVGALQFALDVLSQRIKSAPALETCKVQGNQGRLDVSAEEADMKPGETRQFIVRSSAGIPRVDWAGAVSPQVEMTQSLAGETVVVQVHYKQAVPGLEQVVFQVSARDVKKQVTINLVAADAPAQKPVAGPPAAPKKPASPPPPPPAKPKPALPGASGPQNTFEEGLKPPEIKALQAKLQVLDSGVLDAATRTAIRKWQVDNQQPLRDGVLQSATYNAIVK